MKSPLSKVLHPVGGLPMVAHVVRAATTAGVNAVALVVGRDSDKVEAAAKPFAKSVSVHVQTERLGTAHAVLAARESIAAGYDDLLVMFGDTPLISAKTFARSASRVLTRRSSGGRCARPAASSAQSPPKLRSR